MKASISMLAATSILSLALASPLLAEERLPGTITVNGKPLKLNGSGVRKKSIFRIQVYIAGLYVESINRDAKKLLATDSARRIELLMTHSAPKKRIVAELSDGIHDGSPDKVTQLAHRLETFLASVGDVDEGQHLSITYVPGQGTTLTTPHASSPAIPGKDFADAVLAAWIGESPLDEALKKSLLGQP